MTIPEIMAELTACSGKFPRAALEEAIAQRAAITPELLRLLEDDTANLAEMAHKDWYLGHLYAMFLLAQFREARAYPLLVNFLSADQQLVDLALGDVLTENVDQLLASVCHGDTSLMKGLIENPQINEYVRAAGVDALVILVREKAIPRAEVIAYFKELLQFRLERQCSYIWASVVCACQDLYPKETMEEIRSAFAQQLVDQTVTDPAYVEEDLNKGIVYALARLNKDPRMHYITDAIKEMGWWASFNDHPYGKPITPQSVAPHPVQAPAPAKVGRNAPCPCGSGKKYKQCCGRS